MLRDGMIYATIAVKDVATARQFYSDVLGLRTMDENPAGIMYECGGGRLFVYQSEMAGTNQATYAAWDVEDLTSTVERLKADGITFEQYPDMPDVTIEGDVHVMGDYRSAWFKDPDGNVLAVNQMKAML